MLRPVTPQSRPALPTPKIYHVVVKSESEKKQIKIHVSASTNSLPLLKTV